MGRARPIAGMSRAAIGSAAAIGSKGEGSGGTKVEGDGCSEDDECEKGLVCSENDTGKKVCRPGEKKPGSDVPKLWIGAGGQIDLVFLGKETDICAADSWTCSADVAGSRRDIAKVEDTNNTAPIEAAMQAGLRDVVKDILDSLTPREAKVLRMRFGIEMSTDHTLEEVGKQFDVTRERIRQIEAKAIRKLKHPSRSDKLRTYLDNL